MNEPTLLKKGPCSKTSTEALPAKRPFLLSQTALVALQLPPNWTSQIGCLQLRWLRSVSRQTVGPP